jgi:hypothetical protein
MTVSAEPTPAARAARGRIPDFFIVGHHKSGTTALYEMLRRHPQIYMPELKEPKFFASDLPARLQPSRSDGLPQTLEEYLALFAPARPEQRVGEASPSYLGSHTAAGLIAEAQPDARVIAILREPASFVRSLHLQYVESHVERETDLRKALSKEDGATFMRDGQPVARSASVSRVRRYSDHVRYVEQLRRYHDVFPAERVLVLIYDDFRSDNEGTVRAVLRFLAVDDTAPIESIEANPTVRVRSVRLDEMVRSLYAGRGPLAQAVKTSVRTLTPARFRSSLFPAVRRRLVYAEPQAPDAELTADLRRRFRGEVVALSEYLGRDLVSLWGYDSLG